MVFLSKNSSKNKPKWAWSYFLGISLIFALGWLSFRLLDGLRIGLPEVVVWLEIVLLALVVLLMLIAMLRKKFSIMWWEVVLLVVAISGVWIFCLTVFPIWIGIILAAIFTLLPFFLQLTIINTVTLLIGCMGIGLLMALQFPYIVMMVCAFAVAIYDILRKRDYNMAGLFADAWQIGLAPGILIPSKLLDWFKPINKTWVAGSGQIVSLLPFVITAAMVIYFLAWSYWIFGLVWLVLAVVALLAGQDERGRLRTWVFSVASAVLFSVIGLYIKLI